MPINIANLQKYLQKYSKLSNLLNSGYFRKYQASDTLGLTTMETDEMISTLMTDGILKQSPHGFKMLEKTKDELKELGVII